MYDLLYVDPPWFYNRRVNKSRFGGGAYKQYPLMKLQELIDFKPVIDQNSNKNCIMFMWATCPRLNIGLELLQAWGFNFKTVGFVWEKVDKNGNPINGTGYYTGSNAELVLIAVKGQNKGLFKPVERLIPQTIRAQRREHSRKPEEARLRIEKMYPQLSKIEIFSRERREGWAQYGNETDKFTKGQTK